MPSVASEAAVSSVRPDSGLGRRGPDRAERAETPFDMLLDTVVQEAPPQPPAEPAARRPDDVAQPARRDPAPAGQPVRETQTVQPPDAPKQPAEAAPADDSVGTDVVADAPKDDPGTDDVVDSDTLAALSNPDQIIQPDVAPPQPTTVAAAPAMTVAVAVPTDPAAALDPAPVPAAAIVGDVEAATAPRAPGATGPVTPAPVGDTTAVAPPVDATSPKPAEVLAPSQPAQPAAPTLGEQRSAEQPPAQQPPAPMVKPGNVDQPAKPVQDAAQAEAPKPAARSAHADVKTPSEAPDTPAAAAPPKEPTKPTAPQPIADGEPETPVQQAASPVPPEEPAHKPHATHAPNPGEPAGTPPAHAMNERSVAFAAAAGNANATPATSDAATANAGVQPIAGTPAPQPLTPAAPLQNTQIAAAYTAPVAIAGVAVEIIARARDGQNRFEIRLDPPELGRVDVHLRVDRDGNVTSRLIVERSETLDLLRRDAPQLERALHNAGLKTGEHALEFSLRDQMGGRDHGERQDARHNCIVVPDDEAQPVAVARNGYGRLAGLGTGIDIRV